MTTLELDIAETVQQIHEQYNHLQEQMGPSRAYSLQIEHLKHQAIETYMSAVAEVYKSTRARENPSC